MNSIHILLVEDEAPKRTHIERFLKSLSSEITITIAQSVNSALDALEKQLPDLLLLDMSLPTFDVGERESGGRPRVSVVLRYCATWRWQKPTAQLLS